MDDAFEVSFFILPPSFHLDLKKGPYLRADAARRNRRKTQELMKQISRDVLAGVTNGMNGTNNNNAAEVHL